MWPRDLRFLETSPCSTYRPELNPVERVWAYLKSHYLSNRVFIDDDHLLTACRSAWNAITEERLHCICRTDWLTHEAQA